MTGFGRERNCCFGEGQTKKADNLLPTRFRYGETRQRSLGADIVEDARNKQRTFCLSSVKQESWEEEMMQIICREDLTHLPLAPSLAPSHSTAAPASIRWKA